MSIAHATWDKLKSWCRTIPQILLRPKLHSLGIEPVIELLRPLLKLCRNFSYWISDYFIFHKIVAIRPLLTKYLKIAIPLI